MKLWKLKRLEDRDDYDVTLELVVRATTEEKARQLAHEGVLELSYRQGLWLNPAKSSCEVLSARGKSEIVIVDFKAG